MTHCCWNKLFPFRRKIVALQSISWGKERHIKVGLLMVKDDPEMAPQVGYRTTAAATTAAVTRLEEERMLMGINFT